MSKEDNFLKISIITPNYNGEQYLEETIKSIINQNYPNLEYIIIDGGSSDGSIDIIKKYEKYISYWISEKDNGLFDALNKGFFKATGNIMGWLNSDDLLHPRALYTINEIFKFDNVKWIQGIPTRFDENGRIVDVSSFKPWSKFEYWQGNYQFIQQESTYWHKDLWIEAGGYIDKTLKYAGDFELWNRFFKYEKLYSVKALIGGFRLRSRNQLSLNFIDEYHNEAQYILTNNQLDKASVKTIKKIRQLKNIERILKQSRFLNHCFFINRIKRKILYLNDFPETIRFDRINQKFIIS